MAPETPNILTVLERLDRLERQNRRLKRAGLLVLTAVGALLLMGQATPKSRTIEAEKFVLKDPAGKTRAVLSMIFDGPHLALNDLDGNPRVDLAVRDGAPTLTMLDAKGNVTWSTPTGDVASTTSTRGGHRPRVFIEAWNIATLSQAQREKGPQPVTDTTQEMATFALRCPQATATIERQKANYLLRLDEYLYFDWNANQNQRTYRSLVFDAEGSQVGTGVVLSSLEESMDGACRTILNPAAPSQ